MIERVGKIVSNDNGVRVVRNVYTDVTREYSKTSGAKKKAILDVYTEAQQRNIIINALLSIVDDLSISNPEVDKLKELKTLIDSL